MVKIEGENTFQPNPGWGQLCETCTNRDTSDLRNDSMPCLMVEHRPPVNPDPEKFYRDGRWVHALIPSLVRFSNGRETCDHYRRLAVIAEDSNLQPQLF